MTERWIYHYSSKSAPSGPPGKHMNEMAAQGWELVSASVAVDRGLLSHHFYWRKRA